MHVFILAQVLAKPKVKSLCKMELIRTPVFKLDETHGVFLGQSFTPHLILWPRPSDTLNTRTGKICFMIGKVSSMRRDSLRDIQSKVMEQKPSMTECYCGSCHVYLASKLSTLAVMDDERCSSHWTKMSRKDIECWPIQSKIFPWKGVIWICCCQGFKQYKKSTKVLYSFLLQFKVCIQNKMQQGELGFYSEVGKVKGSQRQPGEPCIQGSCQPTDTMYTNLATASGLHGDTYASATYNRESIIASLLESREKITWGLS